MVYRYRIIRKKNFLGLCFFFEFSLNFRTMLCEKILRLEALMKLNAFLKMNFLFAILCLVSTCFCCAETERDFDIIIKNGLVYDGTENPPGVTDIGVIGDKIAAMGEIKASAKTTINAQGLVVTPGFIDVHTHNDWVDFKSFLDKTVIEDYNNITQGVTTVITGLCGAGSTHTQEWFDFINTVRLSTNVYHLIPHGQLRAELFGRETQKLNDEQMALMKERIADEMEKGALGLSTGLIYIPGSFADTDELIELCKVIKKYNGIYVSHVRGEDGRRVLESYKEAIKIGREADVPVQISHMKLCKPFKDVTAVHMLEIIENARKEGIDVTGDQYPYIACQRVLSGYVPAKFISSSGIKPEYKTGAGKKELEEAVKAKLSQEFLQDLLIVDNPSDPKTNGRYVTAIAADQHIQPEDAFINMILDANHDIIAAVFCINEEAMKTIMQQEYVFTGSDQLSHMRTPDAVKSGVHPRAYGSFARKISKYALQDGLITLKSAIRSMTALPAKKFRMKGRGELKVGNYADIAVIDLQNYKDLATYENPRQCAEGVKYVLVNGVIEIKEGKIASEMGGRPLGREIGGLL